MNEPYIHEQIMLAVAHLVEKYDLELIDLVGEMNHATWELSVLSKDGLIKLAAKAKGEMK